MSDDPEGEYRPEFVKKMIEISKEDYDESVTSLSDLV